MIDRANRYFLSGCLIAGLGLPALGQGIAAPAENTARIAIQADNPGIAISPLLYGIFFEEVSRAGDGGLYSELIRNRDFRAGLLPDGFKIEGKNLITRAGWRRGADEIGNPLNGWSACGQGQVNVISTQDECDQEGQAGRFVAQGPEDGLMNSGYYGIPVEAGKSYQMLLIARNDRGQAGEAIVELLDKHDKQIGQGRVALNGNSWLRRELTLKATASVSDAKLRISFSKPATVLVRYASLLPVERWHGLPIRVDMAEKLQSLKPAFMRFPGGGFAHNASLDTGWNWKETIGPVERRPGRIAMWGYRSTDGLGYHEYLLLCEAMKMEAIPVVNTGVSCMAFEYEVEPMETMGRWVQDALDAIEYANGPADSTWGKVRAANGHSSPFKIKFLAIGNECGGELYEERYPLFYNAIKKKYPEITLISASHVKDTPMDMTDHHFYPRPEWFFANSGMYDKQPRSPKVFVSELGSMDGHSQGNLIGALGEAVFMMGMERNSDLVTLCCYAPLFVNAKHRNWPHSMFIHNSDMVYGTPSYHVFKMFSETRGDRVLPCAVESPKVRKRIMLAGGVGVGTWATQIEARDVRVFTGVQPLTVVANAADWAGWRKEAGRWEVNEEGSFVQSGDKPLTCARIGAKDWNNYSYTLKVRKTGGQDGAIMYFAHQSAGDNFLLHLGAFGNKVALIERRVNGKRDEITPREPFTMEIGRWYEVKIDLGTERLRCFVDGALLFDLPMDQVTAEEEHDQVFASASRTNDGGIYLRAVNISERPINAAFALPGVGLLAADGSVSWMSGKEPRLENSFEAPEKINQQTKLIKLGGTEFTYTLPPYSLTTFSLRQRK